MMVEAEQFDLFRDVMPENTHDTTGDNLWDRLANREKRTVRNFMMLFEKEEFTEIEKRLVFLRQKYNVKTNSEAFKHFLYENDPLKKTND